MSLEQWQSLLPDLKDIREAVRVQGRKTDWLATHTGVSPLSVRNFLNGTARPSLEWIRKAKEALGLNTKRKVKVG